MTTSFSVSIQEQSAAQACVSTFHVKAAGDCWFIFGKLPIKEFARLSGLFPEGEGLIDSRLSMATGARVVIGRKDDLAHLRANETLLREIADGHGEIFPLLDQAIRQGVRESALEWLRALDVGRSSLALFRLLFVSSNTGDEQLPGESDAFPHNADDFGRCLAMVRKTGAEDLLNHCNLLTPEWMAISRRWPEFVALFDQLRHESLTNRLQELLSQSRSLRRHGEKGA